MPSVNITEQTKKQNKDAAATDDDVGAVPGDLLSDVKKLYELFFFLLCTCVKIFFDVNTKHLTTATTYSTRVCGKGVRSEREKIELHNHNYRCLYCLGYL